MSFQYLKHAGTPIHIDTGMTANTKQEKMFQKS
jgi:hypothetical protein